MGDCKCNCGYTCGQKCGLDSVSCVQQHYKRDCEHVFTGWVLTPHGGTAFCEHCGLTAIAHDMRVGP